MNKDLIKKKLLAIGFHQDFMYFKYRVSKDKWMEFYPFEMRLRMYWKGIDDWDNHKEKRELIFECNDLETIDDFNMCFHLCRVNIKME